MGEWEPVGHQSEKKGEREAARRLERGDGEEEQWLLLVGTEGEGAAIVRERGWLCLCVKNEGRRGAVAGAARPRREGGGGGGGCLLGEMGKGGLLSAGARGTAAATGVFGGEGDGGVAAGGARGTMELMGDGERAAVVAAGPKQSGRG